MLVCAPSNIAVDNLLKKLSSTNSVVRLGHPARVNVHLQHLSLGMGTRIFDFPEIYQMIGVEHKTLLDLS